MQYCSPVAIAHDWIGRARRTPHLLAYRARLLPSRPCSQPFVELPLAMPACHHVADNRIRLLVRRAHNSNENCDSPVKHRYSKSIKQSRVLRAATEHTHNPFSARSIHWPEYKNGRTERKHLLIGSHDLWYRFRTKSHSKLEGCIRCGSKQTHKFTLNRSVSSELDRTRPRVQAPLRLSCLL